MITYTDDEKKKKDLVLKVSTENDDCDDDEEVAFLSLKVKLFLIRKKVKTSKGVSNHGLGR